MVAAQAEPKKEELNTWQELFPKEQSLLPPLRYRLYENRLQRFLDGSPPSSYLQDSKNTSGFSLSLQLIIQLCF